MILPDVDPETWFEGALGEDGVLVSRSRIRAWLSALATANERLRLGKIGTSTEGRPMDAVYIGDHLAGDALDALSTQRAGAVRSLTRGEGRATWAKPVVVITSGIHATEVGGPQSIPEIVHWLVTSDDADALAIRERVITIVVPTLNPDGMDVVHRWNDMTSGTDRAGTLPPLPYHRFAGHDNNRDWLFGNLRETVVVRDAIHATWLPHVTLDQHQMNALGPRFALPPYADPWEPHIHHGIIAASSSLGQAIAADLTLGGKAGVVTGRYFDAWEPSRAIQHYRGGLRILAEAANARLACPIEITTEQLANLPLPQPVSPTASCPLPWAGGTWRMRDIVNYHVAAAKSLLRRVSQEPERWVDLQQAALVRRPERPVTFHIPSGPPALDPAANRQLASILDSAGLNRESEVKPSWSTAQPLGGLLEATLLPKPFPEEHGSGSYDVTSHFLPVYLGATIQVTDPGTLARLPAGDLALIDARCHRAPEAIEAAGLSRTWRAPVREIVEGTLVEAGSWLVDASSLDTDLRSLASCAIDSLPSRAATVTRRDIVLLAAGRPPTPDHGWTRWWLQARSIPFLEAGPSLLDSLHCVANKTTLLVADTAEDAFDRATIESIAMLIKAGGRVIAFGGAGRGLASAISSRVSAVTFDAGGPIHAPGALLRLLMTPRTDVGLGLDRVIPAMQQRDGVFRVTGSPSDVEILGQFAARDTVISGWMSDPGKVRDAPAVVRLRRGKGELIAFSFRPLFRGQMLVTSPLVHNLLYSHSET